MEWPLSASIAPTGIRSRQCHIKEQQLAPGQSDTNVELFPFSVTWWIVHLQMNTLSQNTNAEFSCVLLLGRIIVMTIPIDIT